jgi:cardiolipin synthase
MTLAPPRSPTRGMPGQGESGGTSAGVNIAPGTDDDGWEVPPPAPLADGSSVQLYKDGQALHAAYDAIKNAKRSVCVEVYIFHADPTGRAFAELLARRAREGLSVRVIYDSIGSLGEDPAVFQTMRRAGVRTREFHPVLPWRCEHGWRPFNRDHRKLILADDTVAVLGGQNLGDEYGSSWVTGNVSPDAWRDTAVGVRGPSARVLSRAFEHGWDYVKRGGPIRRAALFEAAAPAGNDDPADGNLLGSEPTGRVSQSCRLTPTRSVLEIAQDSCAVLASVPTPRSPLVPALQKLLRDARDSIEITMSYFAPPEELIVQLCTSARAGVRVRLMLPGRSDVPILLVAARAFYDRLLAAGCEVYERQYAVLHAKTLCVDGRLSIVGSTNLDYRSIQFNCELSLLVHSAAFASQMHDLFEHDVRYARAILAHEWRARWHDRLVRWACMRGRYLL